jgi:hypothetical protein
MWAGEGNGESAKMPSTPSGVHRYPAEIRLCNAWSEFTPLLDYDTTIRKAMCSTKFRIPKAVCSIGTRDPAPWKWWMKMALNSDGRVSTARINASMAPKLYVPRGADAHLRDADPRR